MTLDIAKLTLAWQQLDALAPAAAAPIESEEDLVQATALLERVLDEIGETPGHPLDSLARSLIERVTAYEAVHYPIGKLTGPEMLAAMMQHRPMSQQELAQSTGIAQSTISDLINQKRAFTADHARKLAAFFRVEPGVFLQ